MDAAARAVGVTLVFADIHDQGKSGIPFDLQVCGTWIMSGGRNGNMMKACRYRCGEYAQRVSFEFPVIDGNGGIGNDLAGRFPADAVGVVVDSYHVWWDARLAQEIARAAGRILSYQVCDWVLPLPQDTLLGRGHLGDGVIDFGPISASVAAAGYDGYVEVEIFNQAIWDAPADETAATVSKRFPLIF